LRIALRLADKKHGVQTHVYTGLLYRSY